MSAFIRHISLCFLMACTSIGQISAHEAPKNAQTQEDILEGLKTKLEGPSGLKLLAHGANNETKVYVGTYIYDNIFNALHVSLLSKVPAVQQAFQNLKRHDSIRVWGKMLDLDTPQPHLSIERLVVEKPYDFPGDKFQNETSWVELSKELSATNEIIAEVHAVQNSGELMVLEYKRHILPIFTRSFKSEAASLNRQDIVKVHFQIQDSPRKPIHLELMKGPSNQAIEVLDNINEQHGKQAKMSGELVFFPQGSVTSTNVFALKILASHGIYRTYTLVNFKDEKLFFAIRDKLQKAWDAADPGCAYNDRNKYVNPCLTVTAKGTLNHVDQNQANPQILIDNVDDVEVFRN